MQCQLAIVPGKMPWKSFWSLSISTFATMVALIPNAFFAASWPGDGLFFCVAGNRQETTRFPRFERLWKTKGEGHQPFQQWNNDVILLAEIA